MSVTPTFKEVGKAIGDALSASVSIADSVGIHRGKAGTNSTFPLIRMHEQMPTDYQETIGARVWQYHYISVIAVSPNQVEAEDIARAIDTVLQRGSLTIEFGRHGVTQNIQSVWYQEGDGKTYTHAGAIYRIGVSV